MSLDFLSKPNDLVALLQVSDAEDIHVLVDYITDKGKGRIALASDVCAKLTTAKEMGRYDRSDLVDIGYEIRRFGGNTLTNLYRDARWALFGHTNPISSVLDKVLPDSSPAVDYDEVVRDVASNLKVNFNKNDTLLIIEDGILRKLLKDSFEKMSPEERKTVLDELGVTDLSLLAPAATAATLLAGKMAGFATYKIALMVANAVAKALLGKGLSFAGNAMLTRSLSVVLGPVGWVVAGLWTIADMASPAYRVTMPCVVQIAYMRQKAIMKASAVICPKCEETNAKGSKFCSGCGAPL